MTRQYVTFYEDEIIKRDVARIVSIQTNVTNVCPQQCIMCHKPEWAKIQTGRNAALDPEYVANQINTLPDLETVVLSGGDPMNYRHLQEYIQAIREPIKFGMFTTGIDNAINRYQSLPLERFGYIRFSIDGFYPETWSKIRGSNPRVYEFAWNNVLETAIRFKDIYGSEEGKEKVRVQFTIQKNNIAEFHELVEKCYQYDIPIYGYWVHDYQLVEEDQVIKLRDKLFEVSKQSKSWFKKWTNIHDIIENGDKVPTPLDAKNCVIPLVHAFIDTDGSVFPCCYLVGDNLPFEQRDMAYSYGNLYDKPLLQILSTQNIEKIRLKHVNNQNEICKACSSANSRYYKVNYEAEILRGRRPTFL